MKKTNRKKGVGKRSPSPDFMNSFFFSKLQINASTLGLNNNPFFIILLFLWTLLVIGSSRLGQNPNFYQKLVLNRIANEICVSGFEG